MNIARTLRHGGLLTAALLVAAAGPAPAPTPAGTPAPAGTVIAQRGEVTLTAADVQALLARLDPATRDRLLHSSAALDGFVRDQLLQQAVLREARDRKWDQKPDIAAQAQQAHDAVIATTYLASLTAPDAAYPTDADIQSAYDANKARFLVPRQYHLAQIFIAIAADAPQSASPQSAADDGQKKIQALRQQLIRPRADFADAARKNSQDKASADKGGDLGWVREDQVVPQIRDAVAGLQPGSLSDPIRMQDGWHLMKLLETKPAATAPLADVRDALVRALRQQRTGQNVQAYLAKMQQDQPVQINEIQLSQMPTP